jgi:hypothetical protein
MKWKVMDMTENFIKSLEDGRPRFITLSNESIVKITKITVDDGEQDALYEVLSTVPGAPYLARDEQHFIYKNFVNLFELREYLGAHSIQRIEEQT